MILIQNRVFVWVGNLIGLLLVGLIAAYCVGNDSGHTGFDPYIALAFYVPFLALGLTEFMDVKGGNRSVGMLAVAISILGIAFLLFLDMTNTLVGYERWVKRGLPEVPYDVRIYNLLVFFVFYVSIVAPLVFITIIRSNRK